MSTRGRVLLVPTLRYVVVDVFTDTALAGNQLAVFTDAREIDADLMHALTREMNFSETTFLLPETGSAVNMMPAASGKTICCTTTAMWTARWSKPLRRR